MSSLVLEQFDFLLPKLPDTHVRGTGSQPPVRSVMSPVSVSDEFGLSFMFLVYLSFIYSVCTPFEQVGVGVTLGRFEVVASYAHFVQPDKTVTDSVVKQPHTTLPEQATVIGNGIYQSAIDIFAGTVSAAF